MRNFIIDDERHFSSKTYTFDEKIDLTIRETIFKRNVEFQSHNDARIMLNETTCMGSIRIVGHGLLDINIQGTSILGNSVAILYRGGSLNCDRSTFMGRNTIENHGKFQTVSTKCFYLG